MINLILNRVENRKQEMGTVLSLSPRDRRPSYGPNTMSSAGATNTTTAATITGGTTTGSSINPISSGEYTLNNLNYDILKTVRNRDIINVNKVAVSNAITMPPTTNNINTINDLTVEPCDDLFRNLSITTPLPKY